MNIQNTFWIMLCTVVLLHPYGSKALAGDWPTYAKDAQRSGVTTEELSFPLTRIWTYEPARKPQPAWPEPGKELHRLDFDYAPQTVIAEDLVYFSSTSDDTLRAVWLEDGKTKWRFTTGGPLRFAPTIDDGTAYLASDDGWIYALSSRTGKLKWKFRGAPDDDLMLGNARMISRWPIRSGVLIESNVVYFAAGMWPSEGIHVYALNSKTGEQIWCNDSSGSMYRRQPHRSSSAFSGVSPQGYMMLSGDRLLIPSGRTTPAAFNKKTGNLIYYQPYLYEYPYNSEGAINRGSGGWWGIIGEGFFLNPMHRGGGPNIDIRIGESDPRKGDGLLGYSLETGLREWRLDNKSRAVIDNKVLYAVGNGELEAIDMNRLIKDGYPDEAGKWSSPQPRTYALVKAGKHLLAGGRDSLTAFDARNGRNIWKTSISGQVRGIAVASGHVVISTSEGTIACFEHKKRNSQNNPLIVHERLTWKDPLDTSPANLANTVIKQSGISEGYALVAGEDTSCLAKAIASQTDLHVINLLHDEEMLNINRKRLLTTDMYGSRVTVMSIDNSVQLPFPSFFADLVVVSDGLKGSMMPELYRILRPCGGVMCFPGMENKKAKSLIKRSGAPHAEIITGVDDKNIIIRNKLPEAGEWRYPQADSGNTGVGEDGLAKPPFDLLWFGGPGPDRMMNRHWNGSPPLSVNGRVFVAGQHHVIAFDAYNGREIWSLRLEGAARKDTIARSSNFVADDDSVFVAIGPVCHRLDQATGKRVGVYSIPQNTTQNDDADSSLKNDETLWGYLSVTDSKVLGTTLNGTSIKRAYRGKKAFALMKNGGSAKWIYTCPKNLLSYPVAHGNGRMFIVETSSTNDLSLLIRRGDDPDVEHTLTALDLQTGAELWKQNDLPKVMYDTRGRIENCSIQYSDGVVVLNNGQAAYTAATGEKIWDQEAESRGGRVIHGKWLLGQESSIALHTGELRMTTDCMTGDRNPWRFSRSYGCGPVSGCQNFLFFRSGTVGFYDIENKGLSTFGGVRSGCARTMIPANGLLIIPEGSSGCTCSYSFQTSLSLVPGNRRDDYWYVVSGDYSDFSTKRFKANFGAPGDRRDADEKPWLAFPRPWAKRVAPIPLSVIANNPAYYYQRPSNKNSVEKSDVPWIYTSGIKGEYTFCIDIEQQRSVYALDCSSQPPEIDGKPDDPVWKESVPIVFDECADQLNPKTIVKISKDSTNFYLAYRKKAVVIDGKPLPFKTDFSDEESKSITKDDHFVLFVTDKTRKTAFYCAVACGGGAIDGISDLENGDAPNTWWYGDWSHKTDENKNEWTAEIAIPFETLRSEGIDPETIEINLLSQNASGHGCGAAYLRQPRAFFLFCAAFAPVVDKEPYFREHEYTVKLHFAETESVKNGERIFDVVLQGETILENFNIVQNAGGLNKALIKTFRHITARELMLLKLVSSKDNQSLPPILCGMEFERE